MCIRDSSKVNSAFYLSGVGSLNCVPACPAGVKAECVHQCRVANAPIWQATLRCSAVGFPIKSYTQPLTFSKYVRKIFLTQLCFVYPSFPIGGFRGRGQSGHGPKMPKVAFLIWVTCCKRAYSFTASLLQTASLQLKPQPMDSRRLSAWTP